MLCRESGTAGREEIRQGQNVVLVRVRCAATGEGDRLDACPMRFGGAFRARLTPIAGLADSAPVNDCRPWVVGRAITLTTHRTGAVDADTEDAHAAAP